MSCCKDANRILIVDDSRAVRRSLRNILECNSEWNVCGEAKNGLDAVAKAQELKPDVIVLGMSMPIMNGFDAARELKKKMPDVSILMFTAFCTPEIEKAALNAGASSVSSKSDAAAFVECVRNLLERAASIP